MTAPAAPTTAAARRKAIRAGGIGNFVEWYDFGLYGYFATTLAELFFPGHDPTAKLLSTFAIFAVGFLIRPLGGIAFGHLGDRVGRRAALTIAVALMSTSTVAIGILPGYETVGLVAPFLLLLCRLVQGFSTGGEYSGANTFIIEYAPQGQRGRYAGTVPCWVAAGTITAAAMAYACGELLPESWGWRVPFLLAAPLGSIGLYLRLRIEESPEFQLVRKAGEVEQAPLVEAVRTAKFRMLVLFGFAMSNAIGFYIVASYATSYITIQLDRSTTLALGSSTLALIGLAASALIAGRMLDRYGRVAVAGTATIALAVLVVPAFQLIRADHTVSVLIGQALLGVCVGPISCTTSVLMVELFPAHIRYSASALAYNICYTAFGGTAAYIATWLVAGTGTTLAPAIYLGVAAVISALTALIGLPRTLGRKSLTAASAPVSTV